MTKSTHATPKVSHNPSPKGSIILAQGNALGKLGWLNRRLKACLIGSVFTRSMKQTFSLRGCLYSLPRATPRTRPWASMRQPVGLLNRCAPACLTLAIAACLVLPASAATFDEQRKTVAASIETQSEKAIISLLQAGIKEGKPTQAIAETQKWLRQNLPKDGMLLYYAGQAAELSGDWKSAAALYQQYLKKADLKSTTADDAVYRVYSLLIY